MGDERDKNSYHMLLSLPVAMTSPDHYRLCALEDLPTETLAGMKRGLYVV